MLDEIISYHRIIVGILLVVVVVNIILPPLLKENIKKMVFWTRIGYFAFWMFWSMNIFAGLIVFMFTGRELTFNVMIMIVVSVLLGIADAYRATQNKKLWIQGLDIFSFSSKILLLETALIIAVSLLAISRA